MSKAETEGARVRGGGERCETQTIKRTRQTGYAFPYQSVRPTQDDITTPCDTVFPPPSPAEDRVAISDWEVDAVLIARVLKL